MVRNRRGNLCHLYIWRNVILNVSKRHREMSNQKSYVSIITHHWRVKYRNYQ